MFIASVFLFGAIMGAAGWFTIAREMYPMYRDSRVVDLEGWLLFGMMAVLGTLTAVLALTGQFN